MKAPLIALAVLLGIGVLIYATLNQASVTCEACVVYRGRDSCATAKAAAEPEARRSAIATACAVLTSGVTQTLDCERVTPRKLVCSGGGGEAY